MDLDVASLEKLICPQCRSNLSLDADRGELVCNGCALAYPIRGRIPVMMVAEARATREPAAVEGEE